MDAWIIADADQLAGRIRESLAHLAIDCPARRIARIDSIIHQVETIAGFDGLVFFAARHIESDHIELLRQLRAAVDSEAKVVVVASINDHGTILNTIRAGASDFLSLDDNMHEEIAGFVVRAESERKQKCVIGRVTSIVPCHDPSDASFMAVNLAALMANGAGSCALLDFHFRGGDLALLLKLTPRHTAYDLLKQQTTIDEAMFAQALTKHESGIQLLAGPDAFADLRSIRPQVCQQIISLSQQSHPFVIVNSEDVQHAEQVRALASSDDIVVTMRLDVPSLNRAKQYVEFMLQNRISREQIHVVAIGVGHSRELPAVSVKKVLQISTLHCIPDDPVSTLRSVNVGNPLVLETPQTKISQAIVTFANTLTGDMAASAHRPIGTSTRPSVGAVKAAAAIALNTLSFGR